MLQFYKRTVLSSLRKLTLIRDLGIVKSRFNSKFLLFMLFLFVGMKGVVGQTTLAAGDVIFTGYDSTPLSTSPDGDSFSFIVLKDILSGTKISFTDRGYTASGWQAASASESTLTWTSSATVTTGTEVYIKRTTAYTYDRVTSTSSVNGTVALTEGSSSYGLSLSNVGDQIIAFQGGNGSVTGSGAYNIAGINYFYTANTTDAGWNVGAASGPNSSIMPPGLIGGTSAFYTGSVSGNTLAQSGKFKCTAAPGTPTVANIRSAVMNKSNWELSTSSLGLNSSCNLAIPTTISSLAAGDLAVIGMNSNPDEANSTTTFTRQFALVALADIQPNQDIFITDRGWTNGVGWSSDANVLLEGTILWQPSALITAGTVIIFKFTGINSTGDSPLPPSTKTVSVSTGTGVSLSGVSVLSGEWTQPAATSLPWASASGDQLMIYQGSKSNPTFIYAFSNVRTNSNKNPDAANPGYFLDPGTPSNSTGYILRNSLLYSEVPDALKNTKFFNGFFTDAAVSPSPLNPNAVYLPTTNSGTKDEILNDIQTGDWIKTNATPHNFSGGFGTNNYKSFTIGSSTAPSNTPPTATLASITGTLTVGQTLTGAYTYTDAESNTESGSTFKWYRSDNSAGLNKLAIANATAKTYTLVSADAGKYISFEVTPRDGTAFGTALASRFLGRISNNCASTPVNGITSFDNVGTNGYEEFAHTYNAANGVTAFNAACSGWNVTGFATAGSSDYFIAGEDGSIYMGHDNTNSQYITSLNFKSNDGKLFDLNTIDLAYDAPSNLTFSIKGYRDNVLVSQASYTVPAFASFGNGGDWSKNINVAANNNNFIGIDEFRITPNTSGLLDAIYVDNLNATNFRVAGSNTPPTATLAAITGTVTVGQTLTGTYTYADAESNTESGSTFKWYRSDNVSGLNKLAIASATAKTYTLVSADAGKYISFEVTPSDGTAFGTAVESSKLGEVVPVSIGSQAIYNFENLGNNTSFTSSSVNFTLTGNFIGQSLPNYGSDSPPSAGYMDTVYGTDLTGDVGGLRTNNHEIFKLVSIDVWPSATMGSIPVLPYGTPIKIIGKRNGLQVAEGTYTSVTFNQTPDAAGGNWHRVFVTGTLSSTDIDEFAIELLGAQNYMAVDQFSYKELRSVPVTANTPPTATLASVTGTLTVGQILTGSYTYTDAENNTESGSTFKWYRSDNSAGLNKLAIANATTKTYTLVSADAGKYISFEVIPNDGTAFGTAVETTKQGPVNSAAITLYVNKNVIGGNGTGDSWANAIAELADALKTAKTNTAIKEIWVAKGTYKPKYSPEDGVNFGTDKGRDNTFLLVNDLKVYGGFLGTETALAERNLTTTNASVLSGDLDSNDGSDGAINGNNSYHVIVSSGAMGTAVLDGFTIKGGNANAGGDLSVNANTVNKTHGGGLAIVQTTGLSLKNLDITLNNAGSGAGISNLNSSPSIQFTRISYNKVFGGDGAGMANRTSSPKISNTIIHHNGTAFRGGGIYNAASAPELINVTIANNIISPNGSGAGIINDSGTSIIYNSIVWGDSATGIDGNPFTVKNSIIKGGYNGTSVINGDPMFNDAATGDYTLKSGSPAINAGNNSFFAGLDANTKDFAGNARVYKYSDNGIIDLGAYEVQSDITIPAVTSVSVPANRTYIIGDQLDFTINFDENIIVVNTGGNPQIALTVGTTTRYAEYVSGSGTSALTFRYSVAAGDADNNGVGVGTLALNGGTIRNASGNDVNLTLNGVGSATGVLVNGTAPTVSSIDRVTAATSNATSIDYTITFSEGVTGVDIADFSLAKAGTVTGTISSVSGSGSTYTVTVNSISGDGTLKLDLNASGTGITNTVGNAIAAGFTSGQTYTFDNTGPAIGSVAVPASSTYITGDHLDFTINFNEAVTANTDGGTPGLPLTIGSAIRNATYISGSGTSALTFRYTIASGDEDNNGIAIGTALALNGGTIKDAVGNNATATLNSVGSTATILVDAVAPTVLITSNVSTLKIGETANITFTFNEPVTEFGASKIIVEQGTLSALSSADGGVTWTAIFTPAVNINNGSASITIVAGTYKDLAGNSGGAGVTPGIIIDTQAPVTTIASIALSADAGVSGADLITNEALQTISGTLSANLAAGEQVLFSLDNGATFSSATAFAGSNAWSLAGVVLSGSNTFKIKVVDALGNSGPVFSKDYVVDTAAPLVSSVSVPSNGTYKMGANLDFIINFNEDVTLNSAAGTPGLPITIGTITRNAQYLSGSGTSALTFRYTIASGDEDTNGIAIGSALALNGGTIKDVAGNNLTTTLNSIGSTNGILVDAVAPTVVITSDLATLKTGETATITFTFSELVTGFSAADLTVSGGTLSPISGTGLTRTATFTPTPNTNGGTASISIATGSYTDAAGNSGGTGNTLNIAFDTQVPSAPSGLSLAGASDSGQSNSDKITNAITPTFTGTAEAGSTVTIYDTDGITVLGTGTATGGNWSITVSALIDGSHTITAVTTDAAGNKSVASSAITITVDTTAPAVPSTFAAAPGNQQNELTWAANTETDVASYKVYAGEEANPTSLLTTVFVPAVKYTHTNLVNGKTYYYRIVAVDKAGNESAYSVEETASPKGTQTITFNTISAKTYGDAAFTLGSATSSGGLTVSYAAEDPSVISIDGNKASILKAGTTKVTATQAGNNEYTAAVAVEQTLVVNKKAITASAQALSKTYDGTAKANVTFNTLTATNGLVGTDDVSVIYTTASYNNKNVGTDKAVAIDGLTLSGSAKDNYSLNNFGITGAITKKSINVTAQADSRVYDGTAKSGVLPVTDALETGDNIVTSPTQTFDNKNAGTGKTLTASGLTINDGNTGGNYDVKYIASTNGTITAKSINVTAQADSRTYNGSISSGVSPAVDALATGDNVSTAPIQKFDNKNIGSGKTLTASGLTLNDGNSGSNYIVNYVANTNGVITAKSINVTAQADSRTYNGTNSSAVAPVVDALEKGDNISTAPTQTFNNKNVGSGKTLTASGLVLNDGNSGNNYSLNYVASTGGSITAKSINVTAQADSRTYNGTNASALAPVVDALATGDNIATAAIQKFDNKNVGSGKTLTASGLILNDGNNGNNYSVNYLANTNGVITVKSINVTAQADSRTYDGTTISSILPKVDALETGDLITQQPKQSFDNKNVGSGKTLTASGLSLNDGNSGNNYAVNYVSQPLGEITPARLTYIANAAAKVYGNDNPVLSGTITGFISGDNQSNATSGTLSFTTTASNQSGVGKYQITGGGLSAGNYLFAQATENTTALSISKAPLTITANPAVRCYGINNPVFTVSYGGFKNSDNAGSLSQQPTVSTAANANSPAGVYELIVNGAEAANYTFSYTNGLFTINPLPVITITSDKGEVLSKGESTILKTTGGNTYEWITASGIISGENTAQLTVRPFETTEYRVRVTTAEGCIAEAMYTVQIKDDFKAVEAENFVTPNGDGVNDSWVVKNIDAYPSHTLTIVDRAGRIIYKTRDYQNNWEATLDGAPVTQGTYYYIFQFDKPGIAPLKGFITVVK